MGEESAEKKRDAKTLWEYLEYKNDKYIRYIQDVQP